MLCEGSLFTVWCRASDDERANLTARRQQARGGSGRSKPMDSTKSRFSTSTKHKETATAHSCKMQLQSLVLPGMMRQLALNEMNRHEETSVREKPRGRQNFKARKSGLVRRTSRAVIRGRAWHSLPSRVDRTYSSGALTPQWRATQVLNAEL